YRRVSVVSRQSLRVHDAWHHSVSRSGVASPHAARPEPPSARRAGKPVGRATYLRCSLPTLIRTRRRGWGFVGSAQNPPFPASVLPDVRRFRQPVPMPPWRFVMLGRMVLTAWFVALPAAAWAADVRVDYDRHKDFSKYRTFSVEIGTLVRPDGSVD